MSVFERAAEAFGYDARWRDLLDDEFLELQLATLEMSGDAGPEHFRVAAFAHVVYEREHLDDGALHTLVALAEAELGGPVGDAGLVAIAGWSGLSASQRSDLRGRCEGWTQAAVAALAAHGEAP